MGLQSLFVVNKAGSLIFYRRLSDAAPQLSQNDYLHLASTFHGYGQKHSHSLLIFYQSLSSSFLFLLAVIGLGFR